MHSSGDTAGAGRVADGDSESSNESEPWNGTDRRQADRRSAPTPALTGVFQPRRRADGRREDDRAGYVDRYTPRDVALLMTIFLLNVGDAFFTMRWLNRGGLEANPVMDFFLDIGPGAFLAQKCLVVGFWLVLLLVHKNFRFARIGLYASLAVYALLMAIHFAIVAFGVEPPKQADADAALDPSAIIRTVSRPASE